MGIKFYYIVSFQGVDNEEYSMKVKAKNEYEAVSNVAGIVNHAQNFGYDFKAKFHSF